MTFSSYSPGLYPRPACQSLLTPIYNGNYPGVQWLGFSTSTAGAQVQSLVGELRILQAMRHGQIILKIVFVQLLSHVLLFASP